jgi:hypothetical protein
VLYVLILEIDGERRGKVYADADHAKVCFREASRVCIDGPDDGDGITPYSISSCWLYAVETADQPAALNSAMDGRANLLSSFSLAD